MPPFYRLCGWCARRVAVHQTDRSTFTAALDVLPNLDDTDLSVIRLDLDHARPLTACLDLKISLLLEYVVDPPDADALDVLLGVGLRLCW